MKLSDRLAMYRGEIKRSKRWRENYDDDWRRYVDLYQGKQHAYTTGVSGDRLIVNLIFSTINVMAPSVAVNNPRFVVNARKPENAPNAIITEEVLNYLWRQHRYQDEFRQAVNDGLIIGHGWCKVGYKFTKPPEEKKAGQDTEDPNKEGSDVGIDDRDDVDGNVESEMYVYDDRPFVERLSPFDMYVDPDARHPKEMCWIAQRVWRPVADVNVDSRYSSTARKKVNGTSWSRWSTNDMDARSGDDKPDKGPKSFCEIIEFYDIKRRTVCTFALSGEDQTESDGGFLIKPKPMPYGSGHPFEMVRNYEISDHFYPLGDVSQIESLQLELNQTRSQMMNDRKRFARKWIYREDAFDRDGIAALQSDIDNTMVPAIGDENLQNVVVPMPAVITPAEFYDQSSLITNDIDRVSGVSDYQRGSAQTAVKRTATEAAMIQDAANARAQDRLARIEGALARMGERVISLMQQFLTGDQVARVVTIPAKAWFNYDASYLQGQFDYEVAAGSTEPMNETFRRQSALQLVDASMPFLEMGVANPMTLYQLVLQKGFQVKDVERYVQEPPPPMPPEGMPPEGMPGQEQMPPEGMVPPMQPGPEGAMGPEQMPPQGGPPPMPPEGGPPIPPEMLQQLMGGGGPPPQAMPPQQMGGDPLAGIPPEMLMQLLANGGPPVPQ